MNQIGTFSLSLFRMGNEIASADRSKSKVDYRNPSFPRSKRGIFDNLNVRRYAVVFCPLNLKLFYYWLRESFLPYGVKIVNHLEKYTHEIFFVVIHENYTVHCSFMKAYWNSTFPPHL